MNLSSWVDWGNKMLECFDNLPKNMQEAYAFILDYKELLVELKTLSVLWSISNPSVKRKASVLLPAKVQEVYHAARYR